MSKNAALSTVTVLAVLLCGPLSRGETSPRISFPDDPIDTLSRVSAQVAAAAGNASKWVVVTNSPEEGFAAGVLNTANDTALLMMCIPDEDDGDPTRGIVIAWNGTTTVLGSYYDHLDEIPVSFRWSDGVNQANRSDWYKFVNEDSDSSSALTVDEDERTNVLDRLEETSSISIAVRKSPLGSTYARTSFAWSNDAPVEGMDDCGQSQIGDGASDLDGFDCSYTDKPDGGFVLDCSPKP